MSLSVCNNMFQREGHFPLDSSKQVPQNVKQISCRRIFLATQISHVSYNLKRHMFTASHLWTPILTHMNPAHSLPPYFSGILFNIIHPSTPVSSKSLLPSGFPAKILYSFIISQCMTYVLLSLSFYYLNTTYLTFTFETYKLYSISLYNPLHPLSWV